MGIYEQINGYIIYWNLQAFGILQFALENTFSLE